MYPLCHLFVPLLIFEIPKLKNSYKANRLALIIGSLFPDIIDKSIHFINRESGIMYCHNFLFVFLSFLFLHVLSKGKKEISIPFLIGMLIHLALDLPYIPIFYPFIHYEHEIIETPFKYYASKYFNNVFIITTEISSGIGLIWIIKKNRIFTIQQLKNYLNIKLDIDEQATTSMVSKNE